MKNLLVTACAVPIVVAAAVSAAIPAAAAEDWTMPDVTGEVLQNAVSDVQSAAGDMKVDITYAPPTDQVVYNMTNWHVCETTPAADDSVTPDTTEVTLSIERLNVACDDSS